MLAFFLILVLAAMVLGIVGVVVKGLLYLLISGLDVLQKIAATGSQR